MATIDYFHVFPDERNPNEFPEPDVAGRYLLVQITPIPLLGKVRGVYELQKTAPPIKHGFAPLSYEDDRIEFIHVDSITHKIKIVPHFDDSKQADLMCGLRIWETR